MRARSVTFRLTLFISTASTTVVLAVGYRVDTLVESYFIKEDLNEFDGRIKLVRNKAPARS